MEDAPQLWDRVYGREPDAVPDLGCAGISATFRSVATSDWATGVTLLDCKRVTGLDQIDTCTTGASCE